MPLLDSLYLNRISHREFVMTTTEYRKSQNLCRRCGREKEPERAGNAHCLACTLKIRQEQNSRYHRLKEQGLCPKCGMQKETSDRNFCSWCENRTKASRDRQAQKQKALFWERKRLGICTMCGGPKEPERTRYNACARCAKTQAARNKKSELKHKERNYE